MRCKAFVKHDDVTLPEGRRQCLRKAIQWSEYCWQHKENNKKIIEFSLYPQLDWINAIVFYENTYNGNLITYSRHQDVPIQEIRIDRDKQYLQIRIEVVDYGQ